MSNKLTTYKKPELALLEECKKLRDYSTEERLTISKNLVSNLLADLGVGKNSDTKHHLRAIKHVSDTLGNYTPEEIEKAFQLYISHEFNIDVFQQLNPVVVGRVMREYEFYKKRKLENYRRSKMREEDTTSEEEKEFIMAEAVDRIKKEVEVNGRITGICIHVYDHLFDKGLLPSDKEYKRKIFEKAKSVAKGEAASKATHSLEDHRNLKTAIERIEKGKSNDVINISKRLVLEEYFKKNKL